MFLLLACAPESEPEPVFHPPDEAGPYSTGVTTVVFTDDRGKELTVEVWYPSTSDDPPDPYEEIPFADASNAIRDADPAQGPFPAVAFSHGFFGIRYQSFFLTEWMATHGFVVIAPDHPGNTLLDMDDSATARVALERPGDVIRSVDEVFALSEGGDALLGGVVQTDSYGMSGHSFGGWTTVAVAGGVTDWEAFSAFCAVNSGYDLCDIELEEGASITDAPDPRAVAALPMAPAGWYSFGDAGLASVAPSLVMGGELDDSASIDGEIRPLYDRVASPRGLAILADAGHYAFTDICLLGNLRDDCLEEEGGYIDLEVAHDRIRTLATAFFKVRLVGDAEYEPWLGAIGDEITWEEE